MDTQNENITKIDEKVEEVKEDKTESAQQEKLFHLPSLLIVIVFLSVSFALSWYLGMKQAPGAENKKQQEQKPNWEMVDPKPPVIRCGHLENRKEH